MDAGKGNFAARDSVARELVLPSTKNSHKSSWRSINDCCTTETVALEARDIVDWQLAPCQKILVNAQGRQRFHVWRLSPELVERNDLELDVFAFLSRTPVHLSSSSMSLARDIVVW